ncbi:MAG: hypothetical protein ACPG85_04505, partial [Flavobacteriales bacterium]
MDLSRALLIAATAALCAFPWSAEAQRPLPSGWQLEAGLSGHVAGYSGDIGHKGSYGVLSDTQWHLVQGGVGAHIRAHQRGKRAGWNLD